MKFRSIKTALDVGASVACVLICVYLIIGFVGRNWQSRQRQVIAGLQVGLDRMTESWRWRKYWFGTTGLDDVYLSGRKFEALVFWSKPAVRQKFGLCAPAVELCVAYSGPYFDPVGQRISIRSDSSLEQAFQSFVDGAFGDADSFMGADRLKIADFEYEERKVTFSPLGLPSSITHPTVPKSAMEDAQKIKRLFACGTSNAANADARCVGKLTFAYVGDSDPYWFVFRSCSQACEFKGDSLEEATRGDYGWEVTSRGFISSPASAVERLKDRIEHAAMFSLSF